jgi:hypothetical protein
MEAYGEWRYSSTFPNFGTRWRWVVSFTPQPLCTRGKSPMGPTFGLDPAGTRKPCTAGNRIPSVQPVARHYTDWGIPAPDVCGSGIYWYNDQHSGHYRSSFGYSTSSPSSGGNPTVLRMQPTQLPPPRGGIGSFVCSKFGGVMLSRTNISEQPVPIEQRMKNGKTYSR